MCIYPKEVLYMNVRKRILMKLGYFETNILVYIVSKSKYN